ncbi:MAG: hypothetical protein AAF711_19660 [Planctomycetota bacterium]
MLLSFSVFYRVRSGRIRTGLRGKPADWRPAAMGGGKTGPAVLNPRAQRIKQLVKLGLVALVWNGIVVLVITQTLGEGWMQQLQTIAGLVLAGCCKTPHFAPPYCSFGMIERCQHDDWDC